MMMYSETSFGGFNERNGGERLISADKSSKKLKIQVKMISIIRNSLKDEDKLRQFNECIEHAMSLTEKKKILSWRLSSYIRRSNRLVEEKGNKAI